MSKTGSYFNPELLGYVSTLTGDSGGAVSPLAGNITLEGGVNIETIGVAGSHKITFDLDADIILTSVTADLFYTSDPADGLTITGNTILADGSNADIDIDIEPKGNGVINTSYILATGTIGADELYTTTLATGLTLTDNEIRAVGSDVNVDISLVPKGTGAVLVNGSAAITGTLLVDTLYTSNTATGLTITDNTIVADGSEANIDVTITPKGTGVVRANGNIEATSFYTSDAADGLTITSNSIAADGSNANIDISLTPKGTGIVGIIGSLVATNNITADTFYTSDLADGLTITGNTILADGSNADIDISLTPKGTGIVGIIGSLAATNNVSATNNIIADTFYTSDVADSLTITSNSITANGINANIDISLTPKGTGVIAGTELTLTTALAVGYGGTGLTAPTDHCVLVGSGAAAITPITAGTSGQVLIGSTNNDPVFASVTEGTNIDITEGAGTLAVATTKSEINAQTGTTYQLVAGDAGKTITLTNAAAITLTVPANATVAFETGTVISIGQGGAGTVTVAPAGGVTINSVGALTDLSGTYAMATLTKTDTNEWWLAGSLA